MARILVIDDNPAMGQWVEQVLKSAGHEVLLAVDGQEGVKQHRAAPAQLVITDLLMPVQDGLETIRQLRSAFPEVPIIAMSGCAPAATMLSIAQHQGNVGLLQKPFTDVELLAAVDKSLTVSQSA